MLVPRKGVEMFEKGADGGLLPLQFGKTDQDHIILNKSSGIQYTTLPATHYHSEQKLGKALRLNTLTTICLLSSKTRQYRSYSKPRARLLGYHSTPI